MATMAQTSFTEPVKWKLLAAVRHIPSAENAERKHLPRRQFRLEASRKITPLAADTGIGITSLHKIVYRDFTHFNGLPHALEE